MRCCKHLSCGPRGPPGPAGQVGPAIAFLVQGTQQFEGGLVFHQLLYDTVLTNVGDRFSLETSTFNPSEKGLYQLSFTANYNILVSPAVFGLYNGRFERVTYCLGAGTDIGSCSFSVVINTWDNPGPFYIEMITASDINIQSYFSGYFIRKLDSTEQTTYVPTRNDFIEKIIEGIKLDKK